MGEYLMYLIKELTYSRYFIVKVNLVAMNKMDWLGKSFMQ